GGLGSALAERRRRVEQVERALEEGDAGFLARWIAEASGNRRRMLAEAYEQPGALQRLRVHVPDRPGVLAGITQALGAERINIEDFELQHMSRERGGTLTLLVGGGGEGPRAPGACSRRRGTTWSSRPCWTNEDRAGRGARRPHRRPRRQVDLAPGGADRRALRRRHARVGVRAERRHAVDRRRDADARRRGRGRCGGRARG